MSRFVTIFHFFSFSVNFFSVCVIIVKVCDANINMQDFDFESTKKKRNACKYKMMMKEPP